MSAEDYRGTIGVLLITAFVFVGFCDLAKHQAREVDTDREVNSRVRYPGEERAAAAACGQRKLMAWWIENPRKSSATLHARCAGQVHVEREVIF